MKDARNWETIHQLLSIYQLLLGHPKLKPLLDEVEQELQTLQSGDKENEHTWKSSTTQAPRRTV